MTQSAGCQGNSRIIQACRALHDSALLLLQESIGAPSAVTSPSGTARSGSPFDVALDGRALLDSRLRSTPRTYREHSEFGTTPHSQRRAVSWREVEELECPLAASQVPGASVDSTSDVQCHLEDPVTSIHMCPCWGLCSAHGRHDPLIFWGYTLAGTLHAPRGLVWQPWAC